MECGGAHFFLGEMQDTSDNDFLCKVLPGKRSLRWWGSRSGGFICEPLLVGNAVFGVLFFLLFFLSSHL